MRKTRSSKRASLDSLNPGVLLLAGSVAILAIAEGYFRWAKPPLPLEYRWTHPYLVTGDFHGANDSSDPSPEGPRYEGYLKKGLTYQYWPETAVETAADQGRYFFGNRLDRSFPDPKGKRKRVMIMGASMALGAGASNLSRRWTVLLERELRERLRSDEIDVFTVATHSFVSTQERIALELFVLPKKPEVVLVLGGPGDMVAAFNLPRPGDPYNMGTLYARYESFWYHLLFRLAEHSAFARHFVSDVPFATGWMKFHKVELDPRLRDNYTRGIVSVYSDNIRQMSRRCQQERVPCFFLFSPHRSLTQHYRGEKSESKFSYEFGLAQLRALESAFSSDSRFTDLSHLLDQHPEYYVDRFHFGDRGQELLAHKVAEILLASQVLRR